MSRKILVMLSIPVTLATMTLSSNAALAQFPPPPPMAGPPPMAAAGPPPLAAGGPPAFAARPPIGPGGAPRAGPGGPAPRLGAGAAPRGALAGAGRGGPVVASAVRGTSVTYNRFGDYGRYGHRAAYAAGAYPHCRSGSSPCSRH
ncbi:hypothetical protein ABIC08_007419 [Bradyrhizobium sp. RT9b]|uniref:hypothetical protein n=1 Tax=unclassified Bradyrhizobium TaxID=2631580 RepID=UPI0033965203